MRPAARPSTCRVHAAVASASDTASWSTVSLPATASSNDADQRVVALLRRQLVVRVAEHPQRRAPQRRRVDGRRRGGSAADVHEPAVRLQHPQGGGGRDAEEGIDHEVEWSVTLRADRVGELVHLGGVLEVYERVRVAARVARTRAASDRAAATTRRAPASRASCTAAWPTTPPAPRTRTCSPAASSPRHVSPIHAATRGQPQCTDQHRVRAVRQRHDVALVRRRRRACCRHRAASRPASRTRPACRPGRPPSPARPRRRPARPGHTAFRAHRSTTCQTRRGRQAGRWARRSR